MSFNRIEALRPEPNVPENNIIEQKFTEALFYLGRIVQSQLHRKSEKLHQPERSLYARRVRKQLLDTLRGVRKSEKDPEVRAELRQIISQEAKDRDRIGVEYLTQKMVHIDLKELGMLASRFTVLNPPEGARQRNLPPVFLIPGISNDIDPVAGLAQELAYSGRQVIVIAYPESTLGTITPEFAQAVEQDGRFTHHGRYFAEAIRTIQSHEGIGTYELWSHSTGGPISAEVLRANPDIAAQTQNAVLISPAASVTQSMTKFLAGFVREVMRDFQKYHVNLSKYSFVVPAVKEKGGIKERVFFALVKAINKTYPHWNDIHLPSDSAEVIIWSGEKDTLTKTYKNESYGKVGGQKLVSDPGGTHLKGLLEPAEVIAQIDAQMQR